MQALTPLAKEHFNFIANSAHHTGTNMDPRQDRFNAAKDTHAQMQDMDVPNSIKWQRASLVTHNEVHFRVSGSISTQAVYPEVPPKPTFNAQTIADNVLAFIDKRLETMVRDGASDEELQNILDLAEKGVAKGIGEAKEILNGMGSMMGEIEQGIEQANGLLADGIAQRRENLLKGETTPSEVVTPSDEGEQIVEQNSEPKEASVVTSKQGASSGSTESESNQVAEPPKFPHYVPNLGSNFNTSLNTDTSYGRYEYYALERSFDMQIRTKDGDVVTLALGYQQSSESRFGMVSQQVGGSSASAAAYDAYNSEASQLMFTVNGELDEDELAAIDHLMMQVNKMADEFYSGDVEKAFQSALELDFDSSELSSFALNLKQTEVYQVAETYRRVEGAGVDQSQSSQAAEGKESLQELFSPLANYVNGLLKQIESMQEAFYERNPKVKGHSLAQALLQHPKHADTPHADEREKFVQGLEALLNSRLQG